MPFKFCVISWFGFIHLLRIQHVLSISYLLMEKANRKSAIKFVKDSSQSAVSWSSSAKGMESPRPLTKENTKSQVFTLHTQQRAIKRAMFNYSVATKLYLEELQRNRVEKLQKMIEEEEIRLMRKEMIPRAQLMPLFDRPFFPQRSNRQLTIPREPSFRMVNSGNKCWSSMSDFSDDEIYRIDHDAWKVHN